MVNYENETETITWKFFILTMKKILPKIVKIVKILF